MTRSRFHTALLAIIGLSTAAGLALHGHLGTYSRYLADDFCSAGMAHRLGVLRAVWYWYLNWTGRYTASALDAVFGLLGPAITPLVTPLVVLLWFVALALMALALLERVGGRERLEATVIAGTTLYVTLTLSPNVPQSLYWGQGMRSIVPPLILSTLFVCWLLQTLVRRPPAEGAKLWLLGSFLLALLIGGFNETFATLQVGGLGLACILSRAVPGWRMRRGLTESLLAGMLGAAVAIVIVALSPGNEIRQAFYPPPPALPELLQKAAVNFLSFLGGVSRSPEQRMAIVGAGTLAAYMGSQSQLGSTRPLAPAVILIAGIGLAFASFIPAAYGLSDSPPERTLLVPAHLLTLTLALECFLVGGLLARTGMVDKVPGVTTVLLCLASALLVSAVSFSVARLLASRAAYIEYAEHWDTVDSQILSARGRGEEVIWIQPIRNWAGLNEPNDNPKFWLNQCLREYYGIEVLGLDIP